MSRLAPLGNKCDFHLGIHIRQVAHAQSSVFQQVRNAQQVYGKIGVFFEAVTMRSISLDRGASRLAVVGTDCFWG